MPRFLHRRDIMARGQAGIMTESSCCYDEPKPDQRYTQHQGWGDRARSHKELKDDNYRKPKASEGLAFREKI